MNLPTIGIVGLSHLGIVAGASFASLGFRVTGVDDASESLVTLQKGDCIVPEPGLQELFGTYKGSLDITDDFSKLAGCNIVFIAKDTPTDEERNEMELAAVYSLIDRAVPHLAEGVELVVMSQVPVGFTRALRGRIRALRPQLEFSLIYFVETLVIGNAVERFLRPERLMFGIEDTSLPTGAHLQTVIARFSCPKLSMRLESAELTKAAINMYLATSVTYANTLANICEATGADIAEMIPALRLDRRIGQFAYIKPGLGLSGGHLERDIVMLAGLAGKYNARAELLRVINDENAARYGWLRDAVEREIFPAGASRPKIAIWGIAYKKDTDSTFRAPSVRFAEDFGDKADIFAYDPVAKFPAGSKAKTVADAYAALDAADALVILCDWDEFAEIEFERVKRSMKRPLIIDGLGVLFGKNIPKDIRYIGMGRSLS